MFTVDIESMFVGNDHLGHVLATLTTVFILRYILYTTLTTVSYTAIYPVYDSDNSVLYCDISCIRRIYRKISRLIEFLWNYPRFCKQVGAWANSWPWSNVNVIPLVTDVGMTSTDNIQLSLVNHLRAALICRNMLYHFVTLAHWGGDKMSAISQTTFSYAFF